MFYGIVIIIFLAPFSALAMDADTALEKWHARHPVETPLPVAATVSPVTHRSPLCGNVPARYYGRQEPERWTDECKKK